MTIEGKVRNNLDFYLKNCRHIYEEFSQQDDIDRNLELAQAQATQAILALIEPMSQKRLARIIDLWWRDLSEKRKLSEVILAEWQKGLK